MSLFFRAAERTDPLLLAAFTGSCPRCWNEHLPPLLTLPFPHTRTASLPLQSWVVSSWLLPPLKHTYTHTRTHTHRLLNTSRAIPGWRRCCWVGKKSQEPLDRNQSHYQKKSPIPPLQPPILANVEIWCCQRLKYCINYILDFLLHPSLRHYYYKLNALIAAIWPPAWINLHGI